MELSLIFTIIGVVLMLSVIVVFTIRSKKRDRRRKQLDRFEQEIKAANERRGRRWK